MWLQVGATEPKKWEVKYANGTEAGVGAAGAAGAPEAGAVVDAAAEGPAPEDADGDEAVVLVAWDDPVRPSLLGSSDRGEWGLKAEEVEVVSGAASGPLKCYTCNSAEDERCGDAEWSTAYARRHFVQTCAA